MPKCSFCGKMYEIHKGLTYVTTDSKVHYLCSSKCRKNMLMKRRNVRWVKKREGTNEEMKEKIKAESAEEHKEKSSEGKE